MRQNGATGNLQMQACKNCPTSKVASTVGPALQDVEREPRQNPAGYRDRRRRSGVASSHSAIEGCRTGISLDNQLMRAHSPRSVGRPCKQRPSRALPEHIRRDKKLQQVGVIGADSDLYDTNYAAILLGNGDMRRFKVLRTER